MQGYELMVKETFHAKEHPVVNNFSQYANHRVSRCKDASLIDVDINSYSRREK
jgi:hypothetical protein